MNNKIKSLIELIVSFSEKCKRINCNHLSYNENIRNKSMNSVNYSYITRKELKKFLSNINKLKSIFK